MKSKPSSSALSLRSRMLLIAAIALMLCLAPCLLLLRQFGAELSAASSEQQALPVDEAWQAGLRALQQHRQLAAEALSTRPEARQELAAAQQRVREALAAIDASALTQPLRAQFDASIAGALEAGKLDLPKLLQAHQQFGAQVLHAMSRFHAQARLAYEPDPALHQAVLAGLETAPAVGDALSELSAIARAAAIDDIAGTTAALTRYREQNDTMQAQMRLAIENDDGGPLAQALTPLLTQAEAQRRRVDEVLKAAALDVNYPLDQLAAGFSGAAALQADLSARVLATLREELDQRRASLALRRNAMLALAPLLLAALGGVMWLAMRQMLGAIDQITRVTERIADGDLSQPVPPGRGDELGHVFEALAHMQARLRGLVTEIHGGALSIRHAAHEIAMGNQDLATRTEQAAAQLQQTASNVDLLDQVVQQTSRAAGQAATLATQASGVAGDGGAAVGRVVDVMASIHQSSSRVVDITALIDGIAFQTNILALNAAVEAARAGEQGRGFAVVAGEVRNLAQRSASAAREIKQLIQHSVAQVENGSALAGEAGAAMQRIVRQVGEVSAVIQGMDGQSRTQAGQTSEVGEAVRKIDAMTQQNAALVEQSAASALSLEEQAKAMDAAVQAFRL
ncbi:methyl-accepting chemotaxis protein [Paucibacter sp. R3-3]|uniref:Methyl-accepting chemotaxis protein n=1 Tax=Roseateles agri TaxID=3098619 RepID=A0ABU5DLD4_9BURK|nr:methyl-accepting chemotaxis protein [Paucibacter sp. R3-3]MDY0746490.1 methyl-accepting chemotaxis protein [Paucibacter sp. R3-3]